MSLCKICGNETEAENKFCRVCNFSLFQIDQILNEYTDNEVVPQWMLDFVREVDFFYKRNMRTAAFFNAAMEIVYRFTLDGKQKIPKNEVNEINWSKLSNDKILGRLKQARIISIREDNILPGRITSKIQRIRLEGYSVGSSEMVNAFQEMKGIVGLALSKVLIKEEEFVPRDVTCILNLLSQHTIDSQTSDISDEISWYQFETASSNVPKRQLSRLKYAMIGMDDGRTRILEDITENQSILLKQEVVGYLTKMRERWQEREREHERT